MAHPITRNEIEAAIALNGLNQAVLAPSGTGDIAGITATANKSILVLSLHLVASAGTVVTLKSGTTALTGAMSLTANQIIDFDGGHAHLFCESGENFTINQTVDGVDGWCTYVLMDDR